MTLEELEQKYAALEQRITRLEDIEAIQKMTYQYFNCMTLGTTAGMIDYFAEDCSFELPQGTIHGKADLKTYFEGLGGWHTGAESNFLIHPVIDVNGDRATGRWLIYFINTYYLTGQPLFITASMYDNQYVKVDGSWKFEKIRWTVRFGPPGRPPFPGCHGKKQFREEELRGLVPPKP